MAMSPGQGELCGAGGGGVAVPGSSHSSAHLPGHVAPLGMPASQI